MSTLQVKAAKITSICSHPNADTLSIIKLDNGMQVIAKSGIHDNESIVIYIPEGAQAAKDHPLLGFLNGEKVRLCKIRGVTSEGIILTVNEVAETYNIASPIVASGADLKEKMGIWKWVPPANPVNMTANIEEWNPLVDRYTDIEHLQGHDRFEPLDRIMITEKLHGISAIFSCIGEDKFLVNSRNQQYIYPQDKKCIFLDVFESQVKEKLSLLYHKIVPKAQHIISLYGEIAGPGCQGRHFRYGVESPTFFLYDIKVDGKFCNYRNLADIATNFGFRTVPILKVFPYFDKEELLKFPNIFKKSTLDETTVFEGIVVRCADNHKIAKVLSETFRKNKKIKDYSNDNLLQNKNTRTDVELLADILDECKKLLLSKSKDYNGANHRKLSAYFPRGLHTIIDLMNMKVLRLYSLLEQEEIDPSVLEDATKDLINYSSMFIAQNRGLIK